MCEAVGIQGTVGALSEDPETVRRQDRSLDLNQRLWGILEA